MVKLRSNEVFKPGTFPKYTYVYRKSSDFGFTYELRLKQALNTPGYLTSIIGPSKTGKTVLCEKVIGIDNAVSLTGSDLKHGLDFWEIIAKKVGLSIKGEYSEMIKVRGNDYTPEDRSVINREEYISSKDKIIQYFKENNLVLVLDDFHYAPEELQLDIAYQLKDAIRREFKAVVIALPHRADDAIRKNPDLSGRLNLINIEPWKESELKEIAVIGFEKLGVQINNGFASKMAMESLTSPQLMQSICLNLSLIINIDEDENIKELKDQEKLEESYRFTTINLPYKEVVKKLEAGPYTRGQKRKRYELANTNGEKVDIYSLLLKAIAQDPPIISISLEEIKQRVDQLTLISQERIDRKKIRDALQKIHDIMLSSESIYQVFEWKDNQIYILDPLFLFYLRWRAN
ncbi:ATP-binding protein [Terrilactibacillus sp. BCM23-1]|uniref:ATP-binding protein n=1 Tax=Terrilactibacillus tamarindi TaxID=2599694 RepID=A0A6N8CN82_9BACI|nr:ATP-binding protein [Terrilactibacillus tamarindi]MTT31569.1 ATP-binding protein [Terrilactibacillus tamarindi]